MRNLILVTALALGLGASSAGCSPRMFGAAVAAAAIVGTVAVLAHHDAHFHDEYCGHERRYHHGRWVYYYGDRWEYYDQGNGSWYYYSD